jgi:FkbM family methyltransferase
MTALRYYFIRTPLQEPLQRVRGFLDLKRVTHPELRELQHEDERIWKILKLLLRPDFNCMDIGCHYGSMLSRITELCPNGRHIAFEAIPKKVEFLRKKFPDVAIYQCALCDTAEPQTFWINDAKSGFSSLKRHGSGNFTEISVECARLDDVAPRDRRWNFLKIDVEGAELMVIKSATKLLERDRPDVLFECGPSGPKNFGYEPTDLYDLFTSLGYDIYLPKALLDTAPPIERSGFAAALEYPFQAFNWIARPHSKRS